MNYTIMFKIRYKDEKEIFKLLHQKVKKYSAIPAAVKAAEEELKLQIPSTAEYKCMCIFQSNR